MKLDLTNSYSPANALALAQASQLAYSDPLAIGLALPDFRDGIFFDRRETQGFLVANDTSIILAFRGTEPAKLADWMTDADALLVPGYGGHVHQGFARALEYVWDDITAALQPLLTPSRQLFITGHSLGAALATLAAARLAGPCVVYTFGSPRVGDAAFAQEYDASRTYRYVNNLDVVTRVPSRLMGFTQVGQLRYFDASGHLQTDLRFWQKFMDDFPGDVQAFLAGEVVPLEDHFVANYVARCEQNLT